MKKHGNYCKICGKHKANEKFSGKGHAKHICKECASLPANKKSELETLTRINNLPFMLSADQKKWLKNRTEDKRPVVRALAQQEYSLRFDNFAGFDDDFFDAEMQEEIAFQRHLTPEIFATINPNDQLLDFNIFMQANAGDPFSIEKVLEHHHDELWGYLPAEMDEIATQCHEDLLRAFREAIQRYQIHLDDTYYCYDEILEIAHSILDMEDAEVLGFLQ